MKFVCVLLVALLAVVSALPTPHPHHIPIADLTDTSSTLITIDDVNWYFTEYNWYKGGSGSGRFARTANNGAYFKIGFTGTSCVLVISTPVLSSPFMNLRWTVDGQPYKGVLLPNSTQITLASGLQNGAHTLTLYTLNSLQSEDRWQTPACAVSVVGLYVDEGAKSVAPTLRPKRMMVFWDSIGEGVRTYRENGGDLVNNDSTVTSLMSLAAALNAEISVVAFGRQGYTISGNGNVAPLYTPNNDALSAWDKFDASHSRLNASGTLSPIPDYIFCGHGTNDMNAQASVVTASAYGWLVSQREASPSSWIFLTIPYGGFQRQAITSAYNTYASKTNDKKCVLLDLGVSAQEGLVGGGPTAYGTDGLHPTAVRDGQLGAMLAVAAVSAMVGGGK